MNDHLSPVGNPAPPRPRSPDSLISLTIQSRPLAMTSLVPSQSPRWRAPVRCQSCSPYRLVKTRSRSASIAFLSGLAGLFGRFGQRRLQWRRLRGFGQRRLAADRRRAAPPAQRTEWRRSAVAQGVEQRLGLRAVEVLVIIVVDLQDRRVDAGAEALDLDQREQPIRGRFADADPELAFAGGDNLLRTAQPARRRRADLQEPAPDRTQIEHRVEG